MLIAQAACRLGKEGFKGKGELEYYRLVGLFQVFSDQPNLILTVFSKLQNIQPGTWIHILGYTKQELNFGATSDTEDPALKAFSIQVLQRIHHTREVKK